MDISTINKLDHYYFNRIKKILMENGTTIVKILTSQFFLESNDTTGKKSPIQESLEGTIQSIIVKNTDWETCSIPAGGDSSFITPKAVIHIESKTVDCTDGDALENKLNLRRNQTSYFTEECSNQSPPFQSNLPTNYGHKIFGKDLTCLTYVVRVVYDLKEGFSTFDDFKVFLYSIPNGKLKPELGEEIIGAGKSASENYIYPVKDFINNYEYENLINNTVDGFKAVEIAYTKDGDTNYKLDIKGGLDKIKDFDEEKKKEFKLIKEIIFKRKSKAKLNSFIKECFEGAEYLRISSNLNLDKYTKILSSIQDLNDKNLFIWIYELESPGNYKNKLDDKYSNLETKIIEANWDSCNSKFLYTKNVTEESIDRKKIISKLEKIYKSLSINKQRPDIRFLYGSTNLSNTIDDSIVWKRVEKIELY